MILANDATGKANFLRTASFWTNNDKNPMLSSRKLHIFLKNKFEIHSRIGKNNPINYKILCNQLSDGTNEICEIGIN